MSSDQQVGVVVKLAENEELIGQLYEAYARRFADHGEFWHRLAAEEATHARWIRSLASKVGGGTLYLNESRFNAPAIQTFANYLRNELAVSCGRDRSLVNAVSITLYVEESLIERKYFEVFETDSAELKHVLNDLDTATREHVRRVKEMLKAVKEPRARDWRSDRGAGFRAFRSSSSDSFCAGPIA